MRNIALQLYTVRTALAADPAATLDGVAAAGYTAAELFGTNLMQLYTLLKQRGIRVSSGHTSLNVLNDEALLDKTAGEYASMGATHLALAWIPPEARNGLAGYQSLAKQLATAAKVVAKHGLQLCYHNHDFEFARVEDGRYALDVILEETPAEHVKCELDLYWVQKADVDPVSVLRRHHGRVPLVHVKDMTKDATRSFEIVGEGCMDWDAILPEAQAAGAQWYIVEQDSCPQGEIESVRRSLKNIKTCGWDKAR